jgi:hypothetical protein
LIHGGGGEVVAAAAAAVVVVLDGFKTGEACSGNLSYLNLEMVEGMKVTKDVVFYYSGTQTVFPAVVKEGSCLGPCM